MMPRRLMRTSPIAVVAVVSLLLIAVNQIYRAFVAPQGEQIAADYGGLRLGLADAGLKAQGTLCKQVVEVNDAMHAMAVKQVQQVSDAVTRSRPFSEELIGTMKALTSTLDFAQSAAELPLLTTREVQNVAIVMILSDGGLCGGQGSDAIHLLRSRIESFNANDIQPRLLVVGSRADEMVAQLSKGALQNGFHYNLEEHLVFPMHKSTVILAKQVSNKVQDMFLSGEVDKVEVVLRQHTTAGSQDSTVESLLPISAVEIQELEDEEAEEKVEAADLRSLTACKAMAPSTPAKELAPSTVFGQSAEQMLNSMLPMYLSARLQDLLHAGRSSELECRIAGIKAHASSSQCYSQHPLESSQDFFDMNAARLAARLLPVVEESR